MTKKYKFPQPNDYPPKNPVIICPGDRVLNLYNQETGKEAQRLSKAVKTWFVTAAAAEGFAGAHFVPEVETHHGAGCLLQLPGEKKQTNLVSAALDFVDVTNDDTEQ